MRGTPRQNQAYQLAYSQLHRAELRQKQQAIRDSRKAGTRPAVAVLPDGLIDGPHGLKVDPEAGIVYGIYGRPVGIVRGGYVAYDGRSMGNGHLLVHRIVWESVHGPLPQGKEINHINGIKADNRIQNLEAVTHQQNMLHAYATGLKSNFGEKHPSHKLTEAQVRELRNLKGVLPMKVLAARYGISRRNAADVAAGKTWKEVV